MYASENCAKVSYLFPGCFYEYKIGCDLVVKLFDVENLFFFSLTEEDLESLCVNETDFIVVSSEPFNVNGTEINPKCLSNYSERYFKFNLTDCYPNVQVMNLNV